MKRGISRRSYTVEEWEARLAMVDRAIRWLEVASADDAQAKEPAMWVINELKAPRKRAELSAVVAKARRSRR